MELERLNGTDPAYVSSLPAKMSFLHGSGKVSTRIKALTTHLLSPLSPAPSIAVNEELWSVKNTMFAAQQMLLSASALGVAATPMEGFDELRLCYALGVPPEEYTIPLVISMGYATENVEGGERKAKLRYKMEDMCFTDRFGDKLDRVDYSDQS